MITLLTNHSCSKSNCALDYVQLFPEFEIQSRAYLEEPLSKAELQHLAQKISNPVADLVRTGDKFFEEKYGQNTFSDEAYIDLLVQHPLLLQRPILIDGDIAIIGRPPELILEYLKSKQS